MEKVTSKRLICLITRNLYRYISETRLCKHFAFNVLSMETLARGDIQVIDIFVNTAWTTRKKVAKTEYCNLTPWKSNSTYNHSPMYNTNIAGNNIYTGRHV